MSQWGDVERMLAALPRITVSQFPVGTPIPKMRSVKPLADYNGFTGLARMRTWEVAKWLLAGGRIQRRLECDLCGSPTEEFHAEDYFDFGSYVPTCRSCHGSLHSRFRHFQAFERRREAWNKPEGHWVNLLTRKQLPIAAWCEMKGIAEPTFADFVA